MKGKRKTGVGNAIPRTVFVAVSVALQVGWILMTALVLNESLPWVSLITRVLAVAAVLQLNSKHTNAAYKMPWIMLILALPVMGLSLYLLTDLLGDLGSMGRRLREARQRLRPCLGEGAGQLPEEISAGGIGCYLKTQGGWPVYGGTRVDYFSQATEAFDAMKRDLEQAEKFIFMEYFIVSGDSSFRELADILIRKARQGVDVRLMYDDMGSVGYVNMAFAKKLSDAGVKCTVFNPVLPVLNLFMNHRDHRKITVIDGKVGFTGGFNLADEYFDRKITYGRWKDTGIRLAGPGVAGLTAAFLENWTACTKKEEAPGPFFPALPERTDAQGWVQPFGDDPLGSERVAENVYLQLIYAARESLYVITPYLIITDEMTNALAMAAKRGVDVRVITPGIPDKKVVYALTRSYYRGLASQGVRIFEYSPGFCHAKMMLCDGQTASIGTSNLDYRSLYLHFENNAVLYGGPAVEAMARDFREMFPQCREVTGKYQTRQPFFLRTVQDILRLFAPMM